MSTNKTIKEKILYAMNRLPDDATFADARYKLDLLESIEAGIRDADAGRLIDHDELFARLLNEKPKTGLVGKGGAAAGRDTRTHRPGRSKGSRKVRKTA